MLKKAQAQKIIAGLLVFIFSWQQVLGATGQEVLEQGRYQATSELEKEAQARHTEGGQVAVLPVVSATSKAAVSTQDFLTDSPLSPATEPSATGSSADKLVGKPATSPNTFIRHADPERSEGEASQTEILRRTAPQDDKRIKKHKTPGKIYSREGYEQPRYSFEEALDQLRPEYAVAVIVKSISKENLEALQQLPFEVAILALHGEYVLFSTGNEEEIWISHPAQELAKKASLITHTHVHEDALQGPSKDDLRLAVDASEVEYVLTKSGAYGYNKKGVVNNGKPYSLEEYLKFLAEAREKSRTHDQVQARHVLNEFTREMDLLNEREPDDRVLFRADDPYTETFEAETMQIAPEDSGMATEDGVYLWADGEVYETRNLQQAGIYEVEIWAMGPGDPRMQARIDNRLVGDPAVVQLNDWQYRAYLFRSIELEAGLHKFAAAFVNDSGDERDLVIDKVIVRKTGEMPQVPVRMRVEAETMQGNESTWVDEENGTVWMWTGGQISKDIQFLQSGVYEIEVVAMGVEDGRLPLMQVKVDERQAANPVSVTRNDWAYRSYVFSGIEIDAGTHNLAAALVDALGQESLSIDKFIIRKRTELPPPARRVVMEAEQMPVQPFGELTEDGRGWRFWENGELRDRRPVLEAGVYQIEVLVYGKRKDGSSVDPLIDVKVDGQRVGANLAVQNHFWSYGTYVVLNVRLEAGSHDFSVTLTNFETDWTWEGTRTVVVDRVLVRKVGENLTDYTSRINDGSPYTTSRSVTVNLTAPPNARHPLQMSFAINGTMDSDYSAWEPFSATKALTLPDRQGPHAVNIRVRDALGNIAWLSNTITLDTVAPTGTVRINNDDPYTTSRDVTLALTGFDATSGLNGMRFSTDGGQTWSSWENFAASRTLTLPAGDGNKEVRYQLRDRAGLVALFLDRIILDERPPTGGVRSARFLDLTPNQVRLELALEADDHGGSGIDKWSYSIDGGAFSVPEPYSPVKIIALPEGLGRRTIDVRFYDRVGRVSEVYRQEVNLEAMRAIQVFDPPSATKPIHELVEEGLLGTDKRGNFLDFYDRDLLVERTQFPQSSFRIDAPTHGATLPSLTAEFEIRSGTPNLLLETGFVIPDRFIRGRPVEGKVQLVIEGGFFKLKVTRPEEETVDGISFLVDREEVIISKHTPQAGKRYEVQFDFTREGLVVYLDPGKRGIGAEPLFELTGIQANPYLRVESANIGLQSLHIYGNTRKILSAADELHELTYTRDGQGNLVEVREAVRWSRFGTRELSSVAYETRKTFDTLGRLLDSTDKNGERIQRTYNALGRLISRVEDANGLRQTRVYQEDAQGNLTVTTTVTYTDGFQNSVSAVTKETFDNQGRRTRLETPAGKTMTYSYSTGNPTVTAAVTEGGFSYSIFFKPDSRGRLAESRNRDGVIERRTYTLRADGSEEVVIGREIPDRDRLGNPVTYRTQERVVTDREGRILETQDTRGRISRSTYDTEGDPLRFEDGFGRVTTWTYAKDRLGNIRRVSERVVFTDDFANQIESVSNREFDLYGNLTAEIASDGRARVHVYEFFTYNRKAKTRTSYFYKTISTLDELWTRHNQSRSQVISKIEWDETGSVTLDARENSVQTRTAYTRDVRGNVTSRLMTTAYTIGGTPVARTERVDYDLHGNVTKQTDFLGNETRTNYDLFDQLLSIRRHLAADTQGTFDHVTTFVERRTRAGILLNRQRREQFRDGFNNPVDRASLEAFDSFGNLTHTIDPTGGAEVIEREFRTTGRISSETAFRYFLISSLSSLEERHRTRPSSLKEKTVFGLLGEIQRSETFDEKILTFERDRDSAGRQTRLVTRTRWTTEDNRDLTVSETLEFNLDGRVTREVLANGDELTHTYGRLGSRTLSVKRIRFGERFFEERVTFRESRLRSGLLVTQSETVQGVDSFNNAFQYEAIRKYDEFGDEIASIDDKGKGRVTELTRFAWDRPSEVKVFEYEGVADLADLAQKHRAAPKLLSREKFNFLGETIETENTPQSGNQRVTTVFERTRRANGSLLRETRRVRIPGEPEKVFVDELTPEGRIAQATDEKGIVTTYTYALTGEELTRRERGSGNHLVDTALSVTRYANGVEKIASRTTRGTDRFGRQVDLSSVQESSARSELAYRVTEADKGEVILTERDARDRIVKLTTSELEDGEGFLAYAKERLGEPPATKHLTLALLKRWYELLGNPEIRTRFPARLKIQEWDRLGNETVTQSPEEKLEKTIFTNDLGRPREIRKLTFFALGEKGPPGRQAGPIVRVPVEAKSFAADVLPEIKVNETAINISGLTTKGVALVILEGADPARIVTRTYTISQLSSLTADLNARRNGDLLILATRGDIGRDFSDALIQALEGFGGTKAQGARTGGAFSMIGIKGNPRGQALEDYREKPGEAAEARNFRKAVERYDLRGSLLRYEDGFGSGMDYTRGFDGEALRLVETREQGAWEKTTVYRKIRDAKGRLTSTSEEGSEINRQSFDRPVDFFRDWKVSEAQRAQAVIQNGKLSVDPRQDKWKAVIFPEAPDSHELEGKLTLEGSRNAKIHFGLRYASDASHLGIRLSFDRLQVVLRQNSNETVLREVTLATPLAQDTAYTFRTALVGRRVLFTLNGNSILDFQILEATVIPPAGALALSVENGRAAFDDLVALRRFVKGRAFGASEILTKRTDASGVTTYFNIEGDVVRVEDPGNQTTKTYEIDKYATGTLKRRKETIEVRARNVDGQDVTTTVWTESHYDVYGRLVRFIDTRGDETLTTYTAAGETESVTYPDGRKIQYQYTSEPATGSRTTREINLKVRRNAAGEPIRDGQGNLIYDEESRVEKTHNKDGDLIFLLEHLAGDPVREEVTYTYEFFPGHERKLKRKEAVHRFIDIATQREVLRQNTFEERDEDGNVLRSRDRDGTEKEYVYREIPRQGRDKNPKRITRIREARAGDVTMHYYFYRSGDSHPGLGHSLPEYIDLDRDEGQEDADDLDFVLQVRDRQTPDRSDDEIQALFYTGAFEKERIERKVLFHLGGTQNPDKESGYVYHFDGSLDQIADYKYEYLYNRSTGRLERQPKRHASTITYKADASGEPRIDKVTDAFTIKNYFYTATGRLERVEETNGAFPNRVTISRYGPTGDIASVTDFYGRVTSFEYVKNSNGRTIAIFETTSQDNGKMFKMVNEEGETTLELDRNGRLALFANRPHPTRLGKIITETEYFVQDSQGWLTPWFHGAPGTYQQILSRFDRNSDGKIEDSDLQTLFNQSGFPPGSVLRRDKTAKVLNREGDLVLSLKPEGGLSIYDYAKDIFEAKRQSEWRFYKQDAQIGHQRIDLDDYDTSSAAWVSLSERLLRAGARDYEELTVQERTQADQERQTAVAEFLVSLGKIARTSDLVIAKTTRRHNSNGELIEEIEPTGLSRFTVYNRDRFGVPTESFSTNSRDGAVVKQVFNRDGEVIRQELTNGLVKEFAYEKDPLGNTLRVRERTFYPHEPQGPGSLEIRELNLLGQIVKVTDRNGVVTDITTKENARGEKEIARRTRYQDTFSNSIDFTEVEKQDRYGSVILRRDRNGRETQVALRYDALGRVSESRESVDYVSEEGARIRYGETFRFNTEGEQIYQRDKNDRVVTFEYTKDAYGNTALVTEKDWGINQSRQTPIVTVKKLSPLGETRAVTDKNGFTTAYAYDKDALGNVTASYEIAKLRNDFSGDRQVDDRDLAALVAAYGRTDQDSLKLFDLTGDGRINEEDAKALTRSKEYGTREIALTRQMSRFADLASVIDRNDRRVNFRYEKDTLGNVVRSRERSQEFQGETVRLYNKDGRLVQMKDQNGNEIVYHYTLDEKGNVLETREQQTLAPKPPEPITERFDARNRRIFWQQGQRTIETTYAQDDSFVEMERDELGFFRQSWFNPQGRKLQERRRTELGRNLAQGAAVTTSESMNTASYGPSRITDGIHDRNYPWYSKNKAEGWPDTEFAQIDLGRIQQVTEVRVVTWRPEEAFFIRSFQVSVSEDGVTWRKVGEQLNLNHQGIIKVSFAQANARFVKIHALQSWHSNGTSYNAAINEVEVFGFDFAQEYYTYETDGQGNTTISIWDSPTAREARNLLRRETKDNQDRIKYFGERKPEENKGFGPGVTVQGGGTEISTAQSKFGPASARFQGGEDHLALPDSDDWDFGTQDFTIDLWFNVNTNDGVAQTGLFDFGSYYGNKGTSVYLSGNQANRIINVYFNGGGDVWGGTPLSTRINDNTWYHFALVRSGTSVKVFINGNQVGSAATNSTNIDAGAFGATIAKMTSRGVNGWIDEFRVTKGAARWTNNFTPPTDEYPLDPNTKLLLHFNGLRFNEEWTTYETDARANVTTTVWDSATARRRENILRSETKNGEGKVTHRSERKPEENKGFGADVSVQGDAKVSTSQSKFGGASGYFDYNGDYLTLPDSDDWDFGTQDFTIDFWFNVNTFDGRDAQGLFDIGSYAAGKGVSVYLGSHHINVYFNGGAEVIRPAYVVPANTWQHFALVRSGTSVKVFINGTQIGQTATNSTDIQAGNYGATIGKMLVNHTNGWIDEFRVSKGTARWTSNFTPPTLEYTTDAQTKLLHHFNGWRLNEEWVTYEPPDAQGNIVTKVWDSQTARELKNLVRQETRDRQGQLKKVKERQIEGNRGFGNQVAANGDVRIDKSQSKFGGTSAFFDRSGDYVTLPDSDDWDFGTGDFTLDGWVRMRNVDGTITNPTFVDINNGNAHTGGMLIYFNGSALKFEYNAGVTSQTFPWSPSANTWYHVAVVRTGTTLRAFINGTQIGADATVTQNFTGGTAGVRVGERFAGGPYNMDGWIDEVRISKGVARWTGNFTPPTAAYTADAGTKLLLHFDGYRHDYIEFEQIRDVEGRVLRTDRNYVRDGRTYLSLIGERQDAASSNEDLGSPLPIAIARNDSYDYAERAIDGRFGQYARTRIGDWLTLELDEPMAVGRIDTYLTRDYGIQYQIEASLDGKYWHTVVDKTQNGGTYSRGFVSDQVEKGTGSGLLPVPFSGVKAKWIRIRGTRADNGSAEFRIEEIKVYPPPPQSAGGSASGGKGWLVTSEVSRKYNVLGDLLSEVQKGSRAESFAYEKDSLENVTRVIETHYKADRKVEIKQIKDNAGNVLSRNTVDGNRDTRSEASRYQGREAYFEYELKETTELQELKILLADTDPNWRFAYWVEISEDGTTWRRVFDHQMPDGRSWQRVQFPPVRAKFVRVGGRDDDDPNGILALHEVEIYGTATGVVDYQTSRIYDYVGGFSKIIEDILPANQPSVPFQGDARYDTAQARFGPSSIHFDGSYDSLLFNDSDAFDLSGGVWTMDFWMKTPGFDRWQFFYGQGDAGNNKVYMSFTEARGVHILYETPGVLPTTIMTESNILRPNTWHHIAIVQNANRYHIFIDGVDRTLPVGRNTRMNNYGGPVQIGSHRNVNYGYGDSNHEFNGWLEEFRISKTARWTSNFTPPNAEYESDDSTALLLHGDGTRRVIPGAKSAAFVKEGQLIETFDRQGRLTRYAYEYDALGNQIGTYQLTRRVGSLDHRTEFSGEVRDTRGRVIKQIADDGRVTYFSYELDEFGNIKKAYVRDSAPETVRVRRNLLYAGSEAGISTGDWTNTYFRPDTRTNYLFDGNLDTGGSVPLTTGSEKPLEFNFSGVPSAVPVGGARVSTAQSKFGGASARFYGSGDYLAVEDSSDFDFGAGEFTIDAWVKVNSTTGSHTVVSKYGDQDGVGWIFLVNQDSRRLTLYPDGWHDVNGTMSEPLRTDTWYHLAVVRSGNTIKFFKDGVQQGADQTAASVYNGHRGPVTVGVYARTSSPFNGWMDEVRISKGAARWTNNFTPPTQEYSPDAQTKLLLHMNGADGSRSFPAHSLTAPRTVDLSGLRLFTAALQNSGYRIEVSRDGNTWTEVARNEKGELKRQWYEHEFNAQGVQKLRLVPIGANATFYVNEIQIFAAGREEKNFQTLREYDFRGNVISEQNILYALWQSRPELQLYFPDPRKKGIWGRYKDKTIADWAKEEGWREDPRLHSYRPQEEWVTQELKDSFDGRRDLQRRFTDETALRIWAEKFGSIYDPRLEAYRTGRSQSSTAASGVDQPNGRTVATARRETVTVREAQELSVGKTAWATTNNGTTNTAQHALDRDPETAWWAIGTIWENAFVVDLEKESEITEVRLLGDWRGRDYLRSFRISTSRDGVNWETASEQSGGRGPREWVVSIPVRLGRYLMVDRIEAAAPGGGPQSDFINELRIFGNALIEVEREYDSQNRLIRETKKSGRDAGITEYSYYANGRVSEIRRYLSAVEQWKPLEFDPAGTSHATVIDGNEATGDTLSWSGSEPPKSFVIKLARSSEIGRVRLKVGGDNTAGHSYSIEASRDGRTWSRVVDKTWPGAGGWMDDEFSPVEAQYFRVTGNLDGSWGRTLTLYEVEAYKSVGADPRVRPGQAQGPAPTSLERFNESGQATTRDNALFLIWKSDADLRRIFPNPSQPSTLPGRWNGKTLVDWAREFGYKHYAALASYAPVGVTEILPGLRQVYDASRSLQERFAKWGNKDSELIQYARSRGWREDRRLYNFGPQKPSEETARRHTFESRFDVYGNQAFLIAKDEKGSRTQRRFNSEGRVIEEKEELQLLWEGDAGETGWPPAYLYQYYTTSAALRNWAENDGFKDKNLARVLADYSPYAIGGARTTVPFTLLHSYILDPAGWLKESKESQVRLEGSELRHERTIYDADGNEIQMIDSEYGTFDYVLYKDREGRILRRTGSGGRFQSTDETFAVDVAGGSLSTMDYRLSTSVVIRNFLLTHGRLPIKDEFDLEMKFITENGHYASRARLTLTAKGTDREVLSVPFATPVGEMDPSLVRNYGSSAAEEVEILRRSVVIASAARQARDSETALETKHLETLARKTFRRLLGRDPLETGSPSELTQVTERLRALNSQSAFERFLREEYNRDAQQRSEHLRKTEEVRGIINRVDQALRIYFGFATGELPALVVPLLKLLKADPAFEMRELSREELDQIRARLLELIEEDIHFGSSAASALRELLNFHLRPLTFDLPTLTFLALFSDILTGVLSKEFVGNLQFSAYTLKAIAESLGLKLAGLRLTFGELRTLTGRGFPVLVSIEERHFVLVTQITDCVGPPPNIAGCRVHFMENGIARVKEAGEFIARWFSAPGTPELGQGVGLFKEDGVPLLNLSPFNLKLKTLTTQELLKVKGAGWFKKLFKKIKKFFQRIVQAIVKVIQKVMRAITRAFSAVFGKTIGGFFAGLVNSAINILTAPIHIAHYALQGDWKGLFKYMAQTAIQIALIAIQFIPGVGQAIGIALQFLGNFIQFIGAGLIRFGAQYLGQSLLGTAVRAAGSFLVHAGARVTAYGLNFSNNAGAFLKDLKAKGFSAITDSLKKGLGSFLNQLNPLSGYRNIAESVTKSLNQLAGKNGLARFLTDITKKISIRIAQDRIDKTLEKSKMSSFLQTILSTVSNAGLQGIGTAFTDGIFPPEQAPAESSRSRAPPIGLSGIFSKLGDAVSSVGGFITEGLKDAAGFVKSLFVRDDSSLSPTAQITLSPEGETNYYRPLDGRPDLNYRLEALSRNLRRADLDEGAYHYLKLDPRTKNVLANERIGNLKPSLLDQFNEARYGAADYLTTSLRDVTDPILQRLGGPYANSLGLSLFIGRGMAEGYIDALRFGSEFGTIRDSLSAAFRNGEFQKAAFNFASGSGIFSGETPHLFRASQGILTEGLRATTLFTSFAGAIKGIKSFTQAGALYRYDPLVQRYRDVATGRFVAQRNLPYPSNQGFAYSARETLRPGTIIDRLGRPSGRFAGKPGASISERGMPPGSEGLPYQRYEVIKPLPAQVGPAAKVQQFNATGGAPQYLFDESIESLVKKGYLRRIQWTRRS